MEKKNKKSNKSIKAVKRNKALKIIGKYLIELLITIVGVLFGFWLNKTFGFSLQIMP